MGVWAAGAELHPCCVVAPAPALLLCHVAEALGVPLHIVAAWPTLPNNSYAHPASDITVSQQEGRRQQHATTGELRSWRPVTYGAIVALWWGVFGPALNKLRTELQLPAMEQHDALRLEFAASRSHIWCPQLLPPPREWHSASRNVFVPLNAASLRARAGHVPPDDALLTFLADPESGTERRMVCLMVGEAAALSLASSIAAALFALEAKAIVVCGTAAEVDSWEDALQATSLQAYIMPGRFSSAAPSRVAILAPSLLAQCVCLCHCGAAALTAAALCAGVPSVLFQAFSRHLDAFWAGAARDVEIAVMVPPCSNIKNLQEIFREAIWGSDEDQEVYGEAALRRGAKTAAQMMLITEDDLGSHETNDPMQALMDDIAATIKQGRVAEDPHHLQCNLEMYWTGGAAGADLLVLQKIGTEQEDWKETKLKHPDRQSKSRAYLKAQLLGDAILYSPPQIRKRSSTFPASFQVICDGKNC